MNAYVLICKQFFAFFLLGLFFCLYINFILGESLTVHLEAVSSPSLRSPKLQDEQNFLDNLCNIEQYIIYVLS